MKEKPILFSGPMVRALLENRKSQTRRVIKLEHDMITMGVYRITPDESDALLEHWAETGRSFSNFGRCDRIKLPYQVGDRLWVRETWCPCVHGSYEPWYRHLKSPERQTDAFIQYRSDGHGDEYDGYWRPSIFMPRWASRLTLEVTGVRAERLQDISEAEAKAEGISALPLQDENDPSAWYQSAPGVHQERSAQQSFFALWDSINGKRSSCAVKDNPWVWAYEFRRVAE